MQENSIIQQRLESVQKLLNRYFDSIDCEAFGRFRQDFTLGKMLRSKLLLAIAPNNADSIKLCAIIELVHFASLLHDDVIDSASLRRGVQSINAKYGDKNAIMLGDILYSKAFYEVALMGGEFSTIISNAVFELSLGELDDVFLSQSLNLDSAKYITMISRKTASLIEAAAICGGILLNDFSGILSSDSIKKSHKIQKYQIYGQSLGIAFQIIDDLLDVTQSDSTLGKESFSDFKEGKTTLPYIYLYEKLDENDRAILRSYFKLSLNAEQKRWITEQLTKHNIIKQVQNLAKDYGNRALSVLDSNDDNLRQIIVDMIDREF